MFEQSSDGRTAILQPRRSLGRRMALVLLPLVLIPVVLIGGTGYLRSRAILEQQAEGQLTSAATSQATRMLEWAQTREQRLQLGSQLSGLREPLSRLLHEERSAEERTADLTTVREEIENLRTSEGQVLFSQAAVLDPASGTILVATEPSWEGQTPPDAIREQLDMAATRTFAVHDDSLFSPGSVSMISYTPMRTGMTQGPDAVLMGVNLETRVGALIEELQIFSQQRGVFREQVGTTFLVMEPGTIVQLPRYSMAPEATTGSTHEVFGLMGENPTGTATYAGLTGESVLGAYEWIPEIGLGVVVEVPTDTIFGELNSLFPFIATLIVVTGMLTVLIAVIATRRMLQPLERLAIFGQRLARGDWEYRVPEDRDDEIGVVARSLNRMANQLRETYSTLEERVEERTRQVRTASEVARAVTSIPSLEELLHQAVQLIRERFDYYHVSIFLLDEEGQNAELRQSTGEAGRALLARGHKLEVGSESIIGWVTANNQPRVASDVSEDPVHFRNELLTETRSEAAVPLQVGGSVLGALDVQSDQPNAFSEEDIEILQTLADQLSAAIQNARLAQTSVAAAERAQLLSEVTGQMSGLLDVDQVLNTAAQSLHRALGRPEIMIRLTASEEDGQEGGR